MFCSKVLCLRCVRKEEIVERFTVIKRIEFCYAHRLLEHQGKCRHLHGHNGVLEIEIQKPSLDEMGMVMDFVTIKEIVKAWVDNELDHKLLLARRDPLVPILKAQGEPMYLMDENPTAENIAKDVYNEARRQGLSVREVRLWETPSGCAAYSRDED